MSHSPRKWALERGWVSRPLALHLAAKIEAIADGVEGVIDHDVGGEWAAELRAIAKTLAPKTTAYQRERGDSNA